MAKELAKDLSLKIGALRRALGKAQAPEDTLKVGAAASGIEEMMRRSGLYQLEQIRPAREVFLDSRWVLGGMLRKIARRPRGQNAKKTKSRLGTSFRDELARLNLDKNRAQDAQRISTLPVKEKEKTYREAESQDVLPTIELLIDVARPYWYQENRRQKHRAIITQAQEAPIDERRFPLLYADPPWKFDVYSEKGLERTADQHYPTLTDDEIGNFMVGGRVILELAADDAALLMWCTSSNIPRALKIMAVWGFDFKASAIWDKQRAGLGLVFRNRHEVLLYGTRGNMPGPLYQPPSVFSYPRGAHSAKPPEIRAEIERMYPDFGREHRCELFARGDVPGWTTFGYEALREAAE